MNSVPQMIVPSWGILLTVLVLVGSVVLTISISGRRLPEIVRALAKLGVVAVALLVVAGVFWSGSVPHVQLASPRVADRQVTSPAESRTVGSASPSIAVELETTKPDFALPEWTRQAVRIDGRRKLVVVSSGRFASEQEAELHGFQQAAVIAAKEYASLDPRGRGVVQPQHADLIKDSAISQRFMEVTQHDFGKFQAPMHQLWLEVALTPELGERLAEPWRQAAVEARLRTLGGWSVWGTVAAALAAFGLRLDSAWNGRRRVVIAGTTITLALGSLAFLS